MKRHKLLLAASLAVLLIFIQGLLPVFAANPASGSPAVKKFSFTVKDLNNAGKMSSAKP